MAAHGELMAGEFSNAMLVRLENGRRVLQDGSGNLEGPSLVIAEGEGLDGVVVLEFSPTLAPTCLRPFVLLRWTTTWRVNWCIHSILQQPSPHRPNGIEPVVSRVLSWPKMAGLNCGSKAARLRYRHRGAVETRDWPPIAPKTCVTDWFNDSPLRDCLKALITTWKWSSGSSLTGKSWNECWRCQPRAISTCVDVNCAGTTNEHDGTSCWAAPEAAIGVF